MILLKFDFNFHFLAVTMLILLLVTIFTFYGFYLWFVAKKYSHLPGHLGSSFPVIGNLYYSLRNSFMSHDGLVKLLERLLPEGGGICTLWFYYRPVVAISDPIIVEKLIEHPAFVDKDPIVYENVTNFWKGTFSYAISDKTWKERRKILTHSLQKHNMAEYHNTFVKMSRRMFDKMQHETGSFDVQRYTMMAALDAVLETHFGCDLKTIDNDELYKLIHWGIEEISTTFFNPIYGFFVNLIIGYTNVMKPLDQVIEICLKKALDKDKNVLEGESKYLYLDDMLQQRLSVKANYKEIKQELMDIIIVGFHGVGILVSGTLIYLASLPEIQKKVWEEQISIFGDSDRDPTITDLKKMDYLERVMKEVLRFVTGPHMIRKTKAEINTDGIIIPKDTTVLICSLLMRMDKHYWEDPLKFDPDRYLRNEPSKNYKHAFSVFGYGIRNCPGTQYCYNQSKVALSIVLRNFKVVSDRRFKDIKLSAQIMMEFIGDYNISIVKR